MIDLFRDGLGGLFLLAGAAFFLVGSIGVIRLPTVFTRLHAASLCDTTGIGLILIGLMVYAGLTLVTVKLIFLLLFLLFMGPVATHALAAAAMQSEPKSEPAGSSKAVPKHRSKSTGTAAAKKRRR